MCLSIIVFLLIYFTEAIACLNGCYAFACSKIYGVRKVKFKTKWPGILNTYLVDKNKCIYTFARTVFNILNRNKTRGYQESTIAHLINLIYNYLINYLHIIQLKSHNSSLIVKVLLFFSFFRLVWFGVRCLTPLSTIFQLYGGGHFF